MNKKNIVKENKDFLKIIKKGRHVRSKGFSLYYYKDIKSDDFYKFGITISKKITNSVKRNKIKRRLREIIKDYKKYYNNGEEYIIIIRKDILDMNFIDMKISFENALGKLGKIKDEKKFEN